MKDRVDLIFLHASPIIFEFNNGKKRSVTVLDFQKEA